jgi:hypothetical protein
VVSRTKGAAPKKGPLWLDDNGQTCRHAFYAPNPSTVSWGFAINASLAKSCSCLYLPKGHVIFHPIPSYNVLRYSHVHDQLQASNSALLR